MAQKKNQNKQSGQLARQSQNNNSNKNMLPSNRNSQFGKSAGVAAAYSASQKSGAPKISNDPKVTRIIHRELVATISGSTTLAVNPYQINPGDVTTFPWLSTIASSYEQYRFRKLRFHFVTRVATSYNGSLLMAPDYDVLDAAPTTEVQASQMNGAVEDVVWRDQILDFEINNMFPLGPRKFIRSELEAISDLKTYDAGQLFVIPVGCTDTSGIGKLWVEYDVDFFIPQYVTTGGSSSSQIASYSNWVNPSTISLTTTTAVNLDIDSALVNGVAATNSNGVVTLPVGSFMILGHVTFSTSDGGGNPFSGSLEIYKNGASLSPVVSTSCYEAAATGAQTRDLSIVGYVSSSGSDTVTLRFTAVGSGTLTGNDQGCQLALLKVSS